MTRFESAGRNGVPSTADASGGAGNSSRAFPPQPPEAPIRRYLTKREKAVMLLAQHGRCAECQGKLLLGKTEYDHTIPVALGNCGKPDRAICAGCHLAKSRIDVRRIAKAKRLHRTFVLGEKKRKRPIKSAGFDKRWRRKFNGTIERRHALTA